MRGVETTSDAVPSTAGAGAGGVAVSRAGHADGNALFDAMLEQRSPFTLNEELRSLAGSRPGWTSDEFPIVLSVGERRAYTANDIFRDPTWRKSDVDGALRLSSEDASRIGLASGDRVRITTAAGTAEATVEVSEAMLAGHASLPNGYGLDHPDAGSGRSGGRHDVKATREGGLYWCFWSWLLRGYDQNSSQAWRS